MDVERQQGGPLSPLLANLLLDDLDKELERRGHCFCRYANDCNIYVRSFAAGKRVLASLTQFLEEHLRLRVNRQKRRGGARRGTQVLGPPSARRRYADDGSQESGSGERSDLDNHPPQSRRELRADDRRVELVPFGLGGRTFAMQRRKPSLTALDKWIRSKLRCVRLKQRKRSKAIADFLLVLGVPWNQCWTTAACGKGWWRMAHSPCAQQGMNNAWFEKQGLISLLDQYLTLQH